MGVRRTRRQVRRVVALLFGAVLLFQAPPGVTAAASGDELLVGCLFPMTGRGGLYGRDSVAAIEMAVAEVNADGGVAGRRLRVLVEDSKSKPAYAVQIAERFIRRENVHFLCGAVSSAVGLAVSDVARRRQTIFVGTDHASSRLTGESRHPYYFRVSNNTRQSMAAGARYLAELQARTGWRRIGFIGPDYDYGHVMWRDMREQLDALGVDYEIVVELWPKLYEPDFTPYIDAILDAAPQILVNGHWGGDAVQFIRQAGNLELFERMRFFNFDAGGNYEVMAALGDEMPLGVVLSARHHNNWPDTEANRRFVNRFYEHAGRYPSYAAEGAYAGIKAIAQVVGEVGDPRDTDELIAALEQLRLKLPEDPEGFTSYMDPETHQIVQMQAIGEVVPNRAYPPATTMLGNWRVYDAEQLSGSGDVVHRETASPTQ
ncbi:ABC transporter substrate-binding protein [Ectothiorhodospiraceae bacterium WFHF3C12]|nr:ABC transporter substrate-binding protein [Ectothiorhodospiraceae bacterium WFHF3C12]